MNDMALEDSPVSAKGNRDVEDLNFMTSFQFDALIKHFQEILDGINGDEEIFEIWVEFSKLLEAFKSCYAISEKKTRKIRELLAGNTLEFQKEKNMDSHQEKCVNDLRRTIHVLQEDLDTTEEQRRELLKEVEDLRNNVKKENKSTQVHGEFLEFLSPEVKSTRFKSEAKENEKTEWLSKLQLEPKSGEVTDIKALKNDLAILVTDFSITRKRLAQLKREVRCIDVIIKESEGGSEELRKGIFN